MPFPLKQCSTFLPCSGWEGEERRKKEGRRRRKKASFSSFTQDEQYVLHFLSKSIGNGLMKSMCLLYSCLCMSNLWKELFHLQCNNSLVSHWYGRWATDWIKAFCPYLVHLFLDREMRVQCSNVFCWPIIIWSHPNQVPFKQRYNNTPHSVQV